MNLPEPKGYRVSREFVAKSQIDTAINLFCHETDHVSAHVLAWAASEMLHGVAEASGISSFQSEIDIRLRPERKREWYSHLKRAYNFSKHADRDPHDDLTDFRPETTGWAIFAGIVNYSRIYDHVTWRMFVFRFWFFSRHPDITFEPLTGQLEQIEKWFGSNVRGDLSASLTGAIDMLDITESEFLLAKQTMGPEWAGKVVFR